MDDTKRAVRRRHDTELKTLVLEQCKQPGASVANIALLCGLYANLVLKRRNEFQQGETPVTSI